MKTKCGFISIVGRSNVGKSTLLNCLLGTKVSITADKPQTTRDKILGIKTIANAQAVYIDTPGIHSFNKKALNRQMNKTAKHSIFEADLIVFVIVAGLWTDEDQLVLDTVVKANCPILLVINKIDKIKPRLKLLPIIENLSKKFEFTEIVPVAANSGEQVELLEKNIFTLLPEGPHYFLDNELTDKSINFRLAEIVREKLTRFLGKELPYACAVEIELVTKTNNVNIIHAVVWVEKSSQKSIVIGSHGAKLKVVGTTARIDMQDLLQSKVHLKLWVKIKANWSDDERQLQSFFVAP